jgi:prophage regulatory protein
MTNTILRMPAVIKKTGLSRAAIYQRITQESFPRPISIGRRAVGWLEADIEEWIRTCVARSRPLPSRPLVR